MAWNMGGRQAFASTLANEHDKDPRGMEAEAARQVADALLRVVGRQAIIAAAADAVAVLGCGGGGRTSIAFGDGLGPSTQLGGVKPGGGQGEDGQSPMDPPNP